METLDLTAKIVRDSDIIATDMDGDTVMMSIEHGKYFGLTGIGGFLWDQLENPISVQELRENVLKEFDIDESTCEADVIEFVENLLESKIVRFHES